MPCGEAESEGVAWPRPRPRRLKRPSSALRLWMDGCNRSAVDLARYSFWVWMCESLGGIVQSSLSSGFNMALMIVSVVNRS